MIKKCIIVDDEVLDRELLSSLLKSYCPNFEVVSQADNVIDAVCLIEKLKPQIVFMDIHLPLSSGFDLYNFIPNPDFLVVFTTGYTEYGIKAVKVGAFDYLTKPIDVDELYELEIKIDSHFNKSKIQENRKLEIYHNRERKLIIVGDIICVEANGAYSRIYTKNGGSFIVSKNISQLLKELVKTELIRTHRSYLINPNFVKSYNRSGNEWTVELENNIDAKVSRKFREEFKRSMAH